MLTRSQKQKLENLRRFLQKWGEKNRRNFVWRNRPTPYRVLIAEFFLQRTRADQAERQYKKFIYRYPSFRSLKSASPKELRSYLAPLGLHKRVKIFKKLVTIVNKRYDGKLPMEYTDLIGLPGVGDYTASATILFNGKEKKGLVDANTIRVFARIFGKKILREEGKRSKFIRECADYFSSLGRDPKVSNWLLLDYGSAINHADRAISRKSAS